MSPAASAEKPVPKKAKTKEDKQAEHIARIKRTLAASLIGIATGALSFYLGGIPNAAGIQNDGFLGIMLMLAGIVVQKHLFILLGMDTGKLGTKDWFYQGFLTFAFWFMAWTILLTSVPLAASFAANATSGQAPVAVAFTDTSTGPVENRTWDFGDGTTAAVRDPVHVYAAAGSFNVSLTVSGNHEINTKSVAGYIRIAPAGSA